MFKSRAPPKNARKKNEETEDGDVTQEKLAEVREMQKEHWGRPRGVPPMPEANKKKDESESEEEEEKFGLDTGFAGVTSAKTNDPHLEAFLAERLYQKKVEDAAKEKSREDKLYEIPAELQVPDNQINQADKMSWMVGLAEVALPVEYKLQNIEATETAKREFLLGERPTAKGAVLEPDAVTRKAFGSRFATFNDKSSHSKSATDDAVLERFRKRMRQ
mmetsp:Transcript_87639/g.137355  ORF Transcript_87639/g.137355 Transcript_87639/m.137355 type:complete len:218 (+) Transcript_87639:84-737(+)